LIDGITPVADIIIGTMVTLFSFQTDFISSASGK
jgi:hypothetical protein